MTALNDHCRAAPNKRNFGRCLSLIDRAQATLRPMFNAHTPSHTQRCHSVIGQFSRQSQVSQTADRIDLLLCHSSVKATAQAFEVDSQPTAA